MTVTNALLCTNFILARKAAGTATSLSHQPMARKGSRALAAMQENMEGSSAPTSENIVKLWIACLAASFSQHGSGHLHLCSMAQGANLNLGLAESVLGEEGFIPLNLYASVWDTVKINAACPGGLLLRSALTMGNPRSARAEIPTSPGVTDLVPRGTLGRDLPSPNTQRRVHSTLCLLVRGNKNAQK